MSLRADWASELAADSHGFARTIHLKHVVVDPDTMRREVEAAFQALGGRGDIPKLRVFLDAGLRRDLVAKLGASPFLDTEDLHHWATRVLQEPHYCIALNGLTSWNDDLARKLQRSVIRPLIAARGVTGAGYDFYTFAGTYPRTPFGVHDDPEDSLLFNLGPGEKEACIWPVDEYKEICRETGGTTSPAYIAELEKRARRLTVEPGDLLFIARGEYHVLSRPTFSLTLGLIPYPATSRNLLSAAFDELMPHTSDAELFFEAATAATECVDGAFAPCLDVFSDFDRRLATCLKRRMLRLESNGYVRAQPHLCEDDFAHGNGSFHRVSAFPVTLSEDSDRTTVFGRGFDIDVAPSERLHDAVQLLNSASEFMDAELVALLGPEWGARRVGEFLRLLVRVRSLEPGRSQ